MLRAGLTALLCLSVSAALAQHLGTPAAYSSSIDSNQPPSASVADGAAAPMSAGGGGSIAPAAEYTRPFSRLALGAKVGVLGVGVQAAVPLASRLNLSGGTSFFSYNDNLTIDGLRYAANLRLRSAEASLDFFPLGGFHISPGALLYDGNQVTGSAVVPGGQYFTLNNVTYLSSTTDPVNGTGSLKFNKAAPKLTVGFGNMLPRNGRHFSVPMELGFAYQGDPKVLLNLKGTACDQNGLGCQDVTTSPQIQANIAGQVQKLHNDVSPARFLPIFSVGFAANF
ncbi:MAG TPA: hypothetical protein VKT75_19370 [Acidobacteriaceae bacterium]|nr:hypothetical protein [Acidobacteriaceae bacterium]